MLKHLLSVGLLFTCGRNVAQENIPVIPKPVSITMNEGNFIIDRQTSVRFTPASHELQAAARFFSEYISSISGYRLPVQAPKSKQVLLKLDKIRDIGPEGYLLNVSPRSITITANTRAGILYGMQSLFQTLPGIRTNMPLAVPCMQVKDYPRFGWRGMHLDVSRHFFSAELVKEYIDLMARYKINTFHWHLVDDQGWRIEIKKYPKLTETGAWRVDHTDRVWGDRAQALPGETATYGGYYTQEQVKDIIAYAAQRNITIVPEIEMPGHVASAIASYPWLSCTQQPQLPLTGGNYTAISSNYCAGNDSVFRFIENVLTEVIRLFPSKYIHIGGDEVDKGPWKKCPRCQSRIKSLGLKNEEELQSYFMKRIEQFLVKKHRKMIGWDEILEGGLAPEATVMSWRGESGGIAAAKMHHDVVMTPGFPCYFDHYQAGPEGEPLAIGGMNTLKNVYDYEPVPKELDAAAAKYVLGAQGNLWTEFISSNEQVEYMVLPRMTALAEVLWSPPASRNWIDFNQRLQKQFRFFEQKGYHYSKGNFKVTIKPVSKNGKLSVALSSEIVNSSIHYTSDGSNPTAGSKLYETPFPVDSSLIVKAVTVVNGQVMGLVPAMQSFAMHKAVGRDVSYTNPPSKYYPADGPNSLTDGVRGTTAPGKYWHGFNGNDIVAVIDLGTAMPVRRVSLGCLQRYRDWIFFPQSVTVEVSADGKLYTTAGTAANEVSINEQTPLIRDFTVTFPAQPARYIRVVAKNPGQCPKGHPGEGQPAWIFSDEIVVE